MGRTKPEDIGGEVKTIYAMVIADGYLCHATDRPIGRFKSYYPPYKKDDWAIVDLTLPVKLADKVLNYGRDSNTECHFGDGYQCWQAVVEYYDKDCVIREGEEVCHW